MPWNYLFLVWRYNRLSDFSKVSLSTPVVSLLCQLIRMGNAMRSQILYFPLAGTALNALRAGEFESIRATWSIQRRGCIIIRWTMPTYFAVRLIELTVLSYGVLTIPNAQRLLILPQNYTRTLQGVSHQMLSLPTLLRHIPAWERKSNHNSQQLLRIRGGKGWTLCLKARDISSCPGLPPVPFALLRYSIL